MKTVWNHSVSCIEQIKMGFGLVDIWRVRHPIKKRFTWSRHNHLVQSRLDFWLFHESLHDTINENDITPCVLSDHTVAKVELAVFVVG